MKSSRLRKILMALACGGSMALAAVWAQQQEPTTDIGQFDKKLAAKAFKKPYSPYAGRTYPTRPLFGDTHLHTSASMDAGAFGCRLGARDAYRFAKGEEVVASMGERVRRLASRLPQTVWHKVQTEVTTKYHDLEHRYGRPTAVAVNSAGIVGTAVPLPGTTLLAVPPLIAVAELHHQLAATSDPMAELGARLAHTEAEIRGLGERWLQDLAQLIAPRDDAQNML